MLYAAKFGSSTYEKEIVLALKNNEIISEPHKNIANFSEISQFDGRRSFTLGESWLYIQIFGIFENPNSFLKNSLFKFVLELKEKKIVEKFHYLRYYDIGEPSLRVRFRLSDSNEKENFINLVSRLSEWSISNIKMSKMTKIFYGTYERELERYGGIGFIEYAETIFDIDSTVCLKNILTITDELLIYSGIELLVCLGMEYLEQRVCFFSRYDKKAQREVYRSLRNNLDFLLISEIFDGKNFFYKDFSDKFKEISKKLNDCSNREYIAFSILHIHFNRLLVNNEKESQVMAIIRHILKDLEYKRL